MVHGDRQIFDKSMTDKHITDKHITDKHVDYINRALAGSQLILLESCYQRLSVLLTQKPTHARR